MPEVFPVDFSNGFIELDDAAATPVSTLSHLCAETVIYGDFRVLEVKPNTWKHLVDNPQVLGRICGCGQDKAVRLKDLTKVLGVDHVCIGLSDLLYVFGNRK